MNVAYSSDIIFAASLWGWKKESSNLYTLGGRQKTAIKYSLSISDSYVRCEASKYIAGSEINN